MNLRKILGISAIVGVAAASGTAFTATSTIDESALNIGSVAQSIAGFTATNVVYTYTASTDTVTAISARAAELLDTTAGTVEIFLNGSATADAAGCTVTHVDTDADTVDDASDISCDIADTANLTAIRFVVNG